jgi:hypothetical protein
MMGSCGTVWKVEKGLSLKTYHHPFSFMTACLFYMEEEVFSMYN